MSDNLEVAKECGAAVVVDADWYECASGEIVFYNEDQLEVYTSRILASQQAAHDAEIAGLHKQWLDERHQELLGMLKAVDADTVRIPPGVELLLSQALEPLRAQVAMLHKLLAKFSYNEYGPKRFPDEDAVLDAINNTQSIAEQFITECEQRGAVKALEEAISIVCEYTYLKERGVAAAKFRLDKLLSECLRATSKKAG